MLPDIMRTRACQSIASSCPLIRESYETFVPGIWDGSQSETELGESIRKNCFKASDKDVDIGKVAISS